MRFLVLLLLLAPAAAAELHIIRIVETGDTDVWQFQPRDVTVQVGDTVRWIDEAPAGHTTTSDGNWHYAFSGAAGDSFDHAFDAAGTYDYYCRPHSWMSGTITVEAPSTTSTTSSTSSTSSSTTASTTSSTDTTGSSSTETGTGFAPVEDSPLTWWPVAVGIVGIAGLRRLAHE